MAKLNGPLFSFGARGKLGGALVFTPWKGLNNVRRYVIPANPKTAAQTTQRGKLSAAVAAVHAAMVAAEPLDSLDKAAYAVWASVVKASTTWFNQACKNHIDVSVAGDTPTVFRGGALTPGDGEIAIEVYSDEIDGTNITAGKFYYGTTPTALLDSIAATITGGSNKADKTITGLVNGTKYYIQFVVDTGENCEGAKSGIYTSTPAA